MRLRRLPDAPFLIDSLPYRHEAEPWLLSVVVKATYVLEPDQCSFAPHPIEIFPEEQLFDEHGALYAPRDLLPAKAHPEIVCVRLASDAARLTFDRQDRSAIALQPPPPLRSNGHALKSLVQLTSEPLGEVDGEMFQFAPRGQWLNELPIGSSFTLHNAHPRYPQFTTRLPSTQPILRVESVTSTSFVVPLQADLLWLDVERDRCTVTWRGQLEHDFDDRLVMALGIHDGHRPYWPDSNELATNLPQNGQSQSMETTSRVRRKNETRPVIAVSASSDAASDGQPQWMNRKPLPPPSRPPPPRRAPPAAVTAASGPPSSRPPPSMPPPSPPPASARRPSVAPPSAPPRRPRAQNTPSGLRNQRPVAQTVAAGPFVPPATAVGAPAMIPARVTETPPRHAPQARPVYPPNPALEMIQARVTTPVVAPEAAPDAVAPAPRHRESALDLLWSDSECAERLATHRELKKFFPKAKPPPKADPILGRAEEVEQAEPSPPDVLVTKVLRAADPTPLAELQPRFLAAARDEAQRDRVLVVLHGKLEISYDERAALEIMADTARPLSDKKGSDLEVAVDHVQKIIKTPLAEDAAVLQGLRERLLDAWTSKTRELPKQFLSEHTRRLLLKKRHHQKQRVLGEERVRGFFRRGSSEVPVYLLAAAGERLPLMASFDARLVAEIVPRQDEAETSPVALLAVALARDVKEEDA